MMCHCRTFSLWRSSIRGCLLLLPNLSTCQQGILRCFYISKACCCISFPEFCSSWIKVRHSKPASPQGSDLCLLCLFSRTFAVVAVTVTVTVTCDRDNQVSAVTVTVTVTVTQSDSWLWHWASGTVEKHRFSQEKRCICAQTRAHTSIFCYMQISLATGRPPEVKCNKYWVFLN